MAVKYLYLKNSKSRLRPWKTVPLVFLATTALHDFQEANSYIKLRVKSVLKSRSVSLLMASISRTYFWYLNRVWPYELKALKMAFGMGINLWKTLINVVRGSLKSFIMGVHLSIGVASKSIWYLGGLTKGSFPRWGIIKALDKAKKAATKITLFIFLFFLFDYSFFG